MLFEHGREDRNPDKKIQYVQKENFLFLLSDTLCLCLNLCPLLGFLTARKYAIYVHLTGSLLPLSELQMHF